MHMVYSLLFLFSLVPTIHGLSFPFFPKDGDPGMVEHETPEVKPSTKGITVFQAKEIVTLNPDMPKAHYIAVEDDKILAIGQTLDEMKSWLDRKKYTINDQFKHDVLLPGFYESHTHPQILGYMWQFPYIGRFDRMDPQGKKVQGCKKVGEILARIKEQFEKTKQQKDTLVAWGYEPIFYDEPPLSVEELDRISAERPIVIIHLNLHQLTVNSAALRAIGYTNETDIVGVVKKDGKLTGQLNEIKAIMPAAKLFPKVTEDALIQATRNAMRIAHRVGVTTMVDAAFGMVPGGYHAYRTVSEEPSNAVRMILYPFIDAINTPAIQKKGGLELIKKLEKSNTDWMKMGPIKFILDGSLQGFTGNLEWPYYLNGENGIVNFTLEQLRQELLKIRSLDLHATIHANGDAAAQVAIDAVGYMLQQKPEFDHRTRIEHAQMIHESQMRQMKALGMNTSMLIGHVHFYGDVHVKDTLGYNRAKRLDPVASALQYGIMTSLHSDVVTPLNPLLMIWTAAKRETLSGRILGPEQCISVLEALKTVTIYAAYNQFEDNIKGSIEVGKLADFTVLARNPLRVKLDEVKDITVKATVVGGKVFEIAQ